MEKEDQETAFYADADAANFTEELLLKIFNYLRIDDICRVGATCSRWRHLTRPYWKIVDCRHMKLTSQRIEKLFSILPSHTKHLRILGFPFDQETPNFRWLRQRCPELETLHLRRVYMAENVTLGDLPLKVKVLSFFNCDMTCRTFFRQRGKIAQIEVLNFVDCSQFSDTLLSQFSKFALPLLQELYLFACLLSDEWVYSMAHNIPLLKVLGMEKSLFTGNSLEFLSQHCTCLEELFLGDTFVSNHALKAITASAFPNLRVLCLKGTDTTLKSRLSVVSALPNLQYLNGFPREDILKNGMKEDLKGHCDHFFFRYQDFDKKNLTVCPRVIPFTDDDDVQYERSARYTEFPYRR